MISVHLIHGSSENRFKITYCPAGLTREEITAVNYQYADLKMMLDRYGPAKLNEGFNVTAGGEEFFFISNPALGLWAQKEKLKHS